MCLNGVVSSVKKLGAFVVKYRIPIMIIYGILLIPSAIGYFLTPNNYDILSYMPDDMNSKQGEQLLEGEFGLSGVGIIMVRGKELWEVQNLKKRIEEVKGVDSVMWIDDYTDIFIPVDFMEEEVREQFISGDSILLQVLFEENARSLPVSYTHLDVYKRQEEMCTKKIDILTGRTEYKGDLQDGIPHGKGTINFENGSVYSGDWKGGRMHGRGIFSWGPGSFLIGEWKENEADGYGTLRTFAGQSYIGQWRRDKFHGKGILSLPDGHRYAGEFKDGLFHGEGMMTRPDGEVLNGKWRKDRFKG